jgi:divalent metal cation (Fe/Co/Zn/Cd) transporter
MDPDYERDNGYKSRKFVLSILSISLIATLGVVYSIAKWEFIYFNEIAGSIVTIVLGYAGISASRAAIPRAMEALKAPNQESKKREQTKPEPIKNIQSQNKALDEEAL